MVCRWRGNACSAAVNTRAHLQRGGKEITGLARSRSTKANQNSNTTLVGAKHESKGVRKVSNGG